MYEAYPSSKVRTTAFPFPGGRTISRKAMARNPLLLSHSIWAANRDGEMVYESRSPSEMSWYSRTGTSTDTSRANAGAQSDTASTPPRRINSLRDSFISRRLRDRGKSFLVHVVALFQVRVIDGGIPGIPRVEPDVLLDKSLRKRVRDIRSPAGFSGCRGIFSGTIGKSEGADPFRRPRLARAAHPQDGPGAGVGEIQLAPGDSDLHPVARNMKIGERIEVRPPLVETAMLQVAHGTDVGRVEALPVLADTPGVRATQKNDPGALIRSPGNDFPLPRIQETVVRPGHHHPAVPDACEMHQEMQSDRTPCPRIEGNEVLPCIRRGGIDADDVARLVEVDGSLRLEQEVQESLVVLHPHPQQRPGIVAPVFETESREVCLFPVQDGGLP